MILIGDMISKVGLIEDLGRADLIKPGGSDRGIGQSGSDQLGWTKTGKTRPGGKAGLRKPASSAKTRVQDPKPTWES